MPDLGSAYVNIVPKAPGIEGNIEQLLRGGEPGAEKAGAGLGKKILGGIAAQGIGAAVGGMVKDAFEAGGALQQSFGGLETIYGDAAAGAKEYAMAAAAAGISANEYAEQAVSMGAALKAAYDGDTTQAMEAANTAIMDMADNAAKMGTPLESVQAAYQGFAKGQYQLLDNLKLGYGGTKTEMERLLADAQAITGVKYDISNLGDIYSAIHVIQGELNLTGVAAGEAETTLTGSLNSVKASWENVMAALTTGEGLETAMSNLTQNVGNFANNVLKMLGELGPQLPSLILGLADVVIDNAPAFIASGLELILKLAEGLIKAIPKLIAKVPEIIRRLKDAFRSIDWSDIGRNIVQGIVNGLNSLVSWLAQSVRNMARNALNSAKQFLGIASPSKVFAQEVGRWIPPGIAEGIDNNLEPMDRSVDRMAMSAVSDMDRAVRSGSASTAAGGAGSGIDYDRLAAAISKRPVVIEGDTSRIFKVVKNENAVRTRATNYNILAARAST
ncbi:MAG: hypothetical protein IJF88_02460 [Oscillospiraceae bacterium]|nr:hypothetical protein [Oscillospiraceae bacterium]MBQ2633428.1 hypothetical protein [Oscillospiraceae bacterium]